MNGVFFWVGRNGEEKVVRVNNVLKDIVIYICLLCYYKLYSINNFICLWFYLYDIELFYKKLKF